MQFISSVSLQLYGAMKIYMQFDFMKADGSGFFSHILRNHLRKHKHRFRLV